MRQDIVKYIVLVLSIGLPYVMDIMPEWSVLFGFSFYLLYSFFIEKPRVSGQEKIEEEISEMKMVILKNKGDRRS